jgi:hypothetical protein
MSEKIEPVEPTRRSQPRATGQGEPAALERTPGSPNGLIFLMHWRSKVRHRTSSAAGGDQIFRHISRNTGTLVALKKPDLIYSLPIFQTNAQRVPEKDTSVAVK